MKIQEIKNDLIDLGLSDNLNLAALIYLAASARKTKNPVSILVSGPAGLGKSTMAKIVLDLFPKEDILTASRMTPAGLMECGDLRGKILHIYEKFKDQQFAQYIRELLSEEEVVYKKAKQTVKLIGPTTLIETTVNADLLGTENKSRCFVVSINKSMEARQNIIEIQKKLRTKEGLSMANKAEEIKIKHRGYQESLDSNVNVVIPFANKISFHANSYHASRIISRILNVISAISFIKQQERRKMYSKDKVYVEAEIEDFYEAKEILSCLNFDEEEFMLTKETLDYMQFLREHREQFNSPFTRPKLLEKMRKEGFCVNYKRVADNLNILAQLGFIEVASLRGIKNSYEYALTRDFLTTEIGSMGSSCYATLSLA